MKWQGQTAVVIASGPSLTEEQCEDVRKWREAGHGKVVVINTSYKRAPWADMLYACDHVWWAYNHADVRRKFKGELWTQSSRSAQAYKLNYIRSVRLEGLSRNPEIVHQGQTSTYQAMNLIYHWGVKRYILLGCDCKTADNGQTHWHGPHNEIHKSPYDDWLRNFKLLGEDLGKEDIEVINATPGSRLHFPYIELKEALGARTLFAA